MNGKAMSQKKDKQKIYNSKEWHLVREAKLQHDPLCEKCKEKGYIVSAQCVHHIIPIETFQSFTMMKQMAFQFTNLMSLCYQCHSEIHQALRSRSREGHLKASASALERWKERHSRK
jgi:5-methylcytosine-specific restriction protein A